MARVNAGSGLFYANLVDLPEGFVLSTKVDRDAVTGDFQR